MDAWRIRRKNYHRPWNELRIGRLLFFRCGTRDKSSEWDSIVVLQLLVVWPKPRAIQPTVWSNSEFCYIMLYIMFWWLSHVKSVIKPHISVNDMYPNDPKKKLNSTAFIRHCFRLTDFRWAAWRIHPFSTLALVGWSHLRVNWVNPQKTDMLDKYWLVVLTILKQYESQWEGLSHILWQIKNVWNHQPEYVSKPSKPL